MASAPTPLDERVVEATIHALEIGAIHLGRRLGLYEALASANGTTSTELAERAGIAERYAREWLEAQAVGGYIEVSNANADAADRRYALTDEQCAVFVTPDDPAHVSSLADMVAGASAVLDDVAAAFRDGTGVPYASYGTAFRNGQGAINRPLATHDLASWLEAIPGVAARVTSGEPVRIADVGMGQGWSTIALAVALPHATVVGIDADPASVADARANAAQHGVDVEFVEADATAIAEHGPFDLAVMIEALHDFARPVEVLDAIRAALAPGGSLLVADENVAETFTAPGDELERIMYGWSVVHCLPACMAEQPSAGIGTVIRPDTVRKLGADAGFAGVEDVDVDGGFFRVYELRT